MTHDSFDRIVFLGRGGFGHVYAVKKVQDVPKEEETEQMEAIEEKTEQIDSIEKKIEDMTKEKEIDEELVKEDDIVTEEIETPEIVCKIIEVKKENRSSISASKEVLQAFDENPQVQFLYFPFKVVWSNNVLSKLPDHSIQN